jgi:hypothetical protein
LRTWTASFSSSPVLSASGMTARNHNFCVNLHRGDRYASQMVYGKDSIFLPLVMGKMFHSVSFSFSKTVDGIPCCILSMAVYNKKFLPE